MIVVAIKKLISVILTIFIVTTVTFLMMKAIPGDPFSEEQALPKEIHQALREHYGLEAPLSEQYLKYLSSVATWNFGPSFKHKDRTVNRIIREGFPISLVLGVESLALAVGAGILGGAISALNRNRWIDQTTLIICTLGVSIPNFAIATILQYLLAFKLELLPIARWGSFEQSILPAISLAMLPMAFTARLVRASMCKVLEEPYIKLAKAKGLSDWDIMFRHVLKNALLPLCGYLGQLTANILVGSFVIEKIFAIPGLGQWFVTSVMNRDYTAILGLSVFYSIILIGSVTFFDLIGFFLDPRGKSSRLSVSNSV